MNYQGVNPIIDYPIRITEVSHDNITKTWTLYDLKHQLEIIDASYQKYMDFQVKAGRGEIKTIYKENKDPFSLEAFLEFLERDLKQLIAVEADFLDK